MCEPFGVPQGSEAATRPATPLYTKEGLDKKAFFDLAHYYEKIEESICTFIQ